MGAWGYDVMDNDSALDWTEDGDRLITLHAIEKALKDYEADMSSDPSQDWAGGEVLRVAAKFAPQLPAADRSRLLPRFEAALIHLKNSAWVTAWNEPDTMRSAIQSQIDLIRPMLVASGG